MSTRILSAYFDDVRKGRKDIAVIRQFLMDTYDRDPVRRGHLLNWLDQAQYEHPIPVTDFLLLRKEIEAAVKNYRDRPAVDEATVIVGSGAALSSECATQVSAAATTVAATAMTESTLVDTGETRASVSQDVTPLPDRSDHAGLHNAATTLRPSPADTLIQPAPALPEVARPLTRRYLLWTALPLVTLALLGVVLITVWQGKLWSGATPEADDHASTTPVQAEPAATPAPVGDPAVAPAPASSIDSPTYGQPPTTPVARTTDLARMSESELEQEIRARAGRGNLLPRTEADTAHFALDVLMQRFPGSPSLLPARIAIKNAHLKASDEARGKGLWEQAQIHLDAAFAVLQDASTGSAGAP